MKVDDIDTIASVVVEAIKTATAPLKGRIEVLEKENEELKQRGVLHDRGIWKHGETYETGAVVSHQSSAWVCGRTHYSTGTDLDHTAFRLLVKRGRDGKDLR